MEHEVHHHEGHSDDPGGQRVGILAAVISLFLAMVTIQAVRLQTDAVIVRNEATDQWSFYQAKKLKSHTLELGMDLLAAMPQSEKTSAAVERYRKDIARYAEESKEIQREAQEREIAFHRTERQGTRFDFGEGLLELALVLCSLYFVSKKRLFPVIGVVAAIAGIIAAVTGLLIH